MRIAIATAVFLIGLVPSFATPQECSCKGHRNCISWLAALVSTHHDVFLELYEPCGGKVDPSFFMTLPSQRHVEDPELADCLDSAQANLFLLLDQAIAKPEMGSVTVYVVRGGYVISAYSIDSTGKVTTEQGEPDYGVSRELGDHARTSPITSRCGPGFLNCPSGGHGYLVAVPVSDARGEHLGEVQLNVFWLSSARNGNESAGTCPVVRKK